MNENAYDAAVRYILIRPHSEYELIIKLKRKGYFIDEINDALDNLKKEKHVDDAALSKKLVLWHNEHKPYGRLGLYHRLQKKGIKRELIEAALDENLTYDIETELLGQLAETKLASIKKLDRSMSEPDTKITNAQRDKLGRFLLSRGFSNGQVLEQLEKIAPL